VSGEGEQEAAYVASVLTLMPTCQTHLRGPVRWTSYWPDGFTRNRFL
jgi:hypothetical protein